MHQQHPELLELIKACIRKDQQAQERLYRLFYAYAMNICLHYANGREEAKDILNEGFFKVFERLGQYNPQLSFKGWLRRLLINTAIDFHRKYNYRQATIENLNMAEPAVHAVSFARLALDDLLNMVQQLSPMYRLVFNLYILEGFTHQEIADQLGISIGTSKSNLARAKENLRNMILQEERRLALFKGKL